MRLSALCILTVMLTTRVISQPYTSSKGTYTVSEIRGCAPFTIAIVPTGDNCDGSPGCAADYEGTSSYIPLDYNDPDGPTWQHTYTEPGIYDLGVLQGENLDILQIEVFENVKPQIEVSNCGGSRVLVNIADNNYDQYVINYNDGSAPVIVLPGAKHIYDYGSPGTQTVTVHGRNLDSEENCDPTTANVDVLASLGNPTITRLDILDASSVRIEFDGIPNVLYQLGVAVSNNPNFQTIRTLYNKTVDTIRNLKPEDNYYCFRVSAFNACDNQPIHSGIVCTANFDLEVLNNENRVTWSTSASDLTNQTVIITDVANNTSFTTTQTGTSLTDPNVICGNEYCYQLRTTYGGVSESYSLIKCGVAFSTDAPDPVSNIATAVGDNGVILQWAQPVGFTAEEYTILKSVNNDYGPLTQTGTNSYTDEQYTSESGSCYKIQYTDACGNESAQSLEACPITLVATLTGDNNVNLSWTPYEGYQAGVDHYTVEKYAMGGTLLQSTDVTATSHIDDGQDLNTQLYVYVVKAIPNVAGLPFSISNAITVIKDPNLFYPAAFTPNGDNLNDIFNVYGQYITSFEMDIYNRWGELMFTTNQLDIGWDGNYKGNAMPEGTYTFVATIIDFAGRTFKRSGSVLLLRKK
jgi:gliding motility-associated-like protein